jgi:hypothetical protein
VPRVWGGAGDAGLSEGPELGAETVRRSGGFCSRHAEMGSWDRTCHVRLASLVYNINYPAIRPWHSVIRLARRTSPLASLHAFRPGHIPKKEKEKKKKASYCMMYLPTVRMLHVSQRQRPATGCHWPRTARYLSTIFVLVRQPGPVAGGACCASRFAWFELSSAAESRGSGDGPARWRWICSQ